MKAYIKLIEEAKQFWNEVVSKNGKPALEGRGVTIWVDDEGEQTDSLYNPPNSPRSYILSQDEDVLFETNEELPVIEDEIEIEIEDDEEVSFDEEKLIEATDKITFEMVEGLPHGDTIKLNDEFELYRYSGDADSSFDLSYEEDEDEEEVNVVVVNHSESGTEVFMVMLNGTEIELETL
tara:strand:+ start:91 stop:627 length:537 start_codon:yes stop_codon:yes gene_type:complete